MLLWFQQCVYDSCTFVFVWFYWHKMCPSGANGEAVYNRKDLLRDMESVSSALLLQIGWVYHLLSCACGDFMSASYLGLQLDAVSVLFPSDTDDKCWGCCLTIWWGSTTPTTIHSAVWRGNVSADSRGAAYTEADVTQWLKSVLMFYSEAIFQAGSDS